MSEVVVEGRDLLLRYGDQVILDRIDFTINEGDFLCILGPSGCGKSTLLRIIAGLIGAEGDIRVYGDSPARSWTNLAFVFQSPRLARWRTARDNVVLALQLRGGKGSKRELRDRAMEYLRLLGIEHLADRRAHMLSGGEQQRVSIARALALEPRMVLMDEPLSALDVQTRNQLRAELVSLWQRTGVTVLFVTHDVEEALTIASRIIVFSQKPTAILADLAVDLPHPRNLRDEELVELRHRIVEIFHRSGRSAGDLLFSAERA